MQDRCHDAFLGRKQNPRDKGDEEIRKEERPGERDGLDAWREMKRGDGEIEGRRRGDENDMWGPCEPTIF